MTSASELFHSRRYRLGLRHNTVDVAGFDSSLADANSSLSHQHRTINRRHHHHYSSQNNRREHRHDFDACDPPSRRILRHRLDHSEHEAVHPEQGGGQSPSGSIINSEDFRSIHRGRATGSDRLPGAVLLARERLLERLRGVSVSGNSRSSSSSRQDDFSSRGNNSFTGTDNNLLVNREESLEEMSSESWQAVTQMSSSQETTRTHPHGLAQDTLNCLMLEVFSNDRKADETSSTSRECTICLEGFQDGDKLIRLHCTHRFHSCCLFPWVRVCGACPNCRKSIVVTRSKPVA